MSYLYSPQDREKILNRCAELLSEAGIASEDAVQLVLNLNGASFDTLNDILMCQTGENDVVDYFADTLVAEGLMQEEDDEDEEAE